MKSLAVFMLVVLAAVLALPNPVATGHQGHQATPTGPQVLYRASMPGITMSGEFDAVNLILEFAPGATAASHTHGGPGIVTVLSGEVTFRAEGKPEQVARAGDIYVDAPGAVHSATNEGSVPAQASFVIILPKGGTITTPTAPAAPNAPPGPKVLYRSTMSGLSMSGEFEAFNLILAFAPGATAGAHTHGGPGIVTMLDGEVTFRPEGKPDQVAKTGEVYVDAPGAVHTATNEGSVTAHASFIAMIPKGAALTTPITPVQSVSPPVGMPSTGGSLPLQVLVLALFVALVNISLGIGLRQMRARRRS